MKFEYDPNKSAANKAKHGIDFEEAQDIWKDHRAVTIDLPERAEPRSMTIGLIQKRTWVAIVTCRNDNIRIISARRARDKEVMIYEEYNHQ
jgi:uncharacterized DUF497 family protein